LLNKVLFIGVTVGNQSIEERHIQQSIQVSFNILVSLLKKNWLNVSHGLS
jgi:ribosomal protein L1